MQTKGFTLIELILIVAIAAILVGVVVGPLAAFRQRQALLNTTNGIVAVLGDARAKTFAALNDTSYGVHFDETEATLFAGTTYTSTAPENNRYTFDPSVTVTWNLNGGGQTVSFDRLTGATNQHGTINLSSATGASRTITITPLGSVAKD